VKGILLIRAEKRNFLVAFCETHVHTANSVRTRTEIV
jgi:hypothetical protein